MAQVAVLVEGGLISGDLLARIAASPQEVDGQRPVHFGVEGRLSDEIQSAFSDVRAYWEAFQRRLARMREGERATSVTREAWAIPLLEELGYDLVYQRAWPQAGGNAYPISHRAGGDAAAPPVHIVGSEQELDRKGELKQSPHAMVQDYLNRSDALWGIVTNGRRLRLLRNTARFSKPSFIELDLQAILEGNLYSEFVLLYRLAHATRLPKGAGDAHECWLERYYQQGIEEGGRVRERLRDGVKEALEILGTGLLAHPRSERLRADLESGRLTHVDYYRQLLRLIYRLLFLMVAEERRLLFVPDAENAGRQEIYSRWYSVERLRKRAEARVTDDGHSDLWEGLKTTFRLFEDEERASRLGLTALDGELFGRLACSDLIDVGETQRTGLANGRLLKAIWQLSTFEDSDGRRRRGPRRRVSFAGLDVEELGSVYESLLDYHPEVRIDDGRSTFELTAGSERKETGSYYTPPELVAELIKSALEPVIAARLAEAETRDDKERALLALKVCDPASGSGHFVLAAARRLGRELARVRAEEAEPNPEDYRRAIRDVIRRCIYAVDKNPLAVDLCKVALWIEGHEPGLPLSFLDHHVKQGDSLVGVLDLSVLADGVPDGAYRAAAGDDKAVAGEVRKRNRAEAKEAGLFRHDVGRQIARIAGAFAAVADLPETNPEEVRAKETRYGELRRAPEWLHAKAAADLWTAAFFAPLTDARGVPTTRDVWEALSGRVPQGRVAAVALDLARAQPFFHWPLEFPEVFAAGNGARAGGFDVMLGNPPWERIKLQEKEFFATRDREIATAPNKAARDRLIKALYADDAPEEKRALGREWQKARHAAECEGVLVRESGRYPLTAFGDINTYAIFAETFLSAVRADGRAGFIVPTGIATDFSYRTFFYASIAGKRLASLIAFDNQKRIFPAVHSDTPFALVTLAEDQSAPQFAFYLLQFEHLTDARRRFTLSIEDIALINPNTRTCPIFRSQADAELTKKIYQTVPVLIDESDSENGNPWGISFMRMFDMSNDSGLFRTAAELTAAGAERDGAEWIGRGKERYLPLYEAKMIHQFDHRWATYDAKGESSRDVSLEEKADPSRRPLPRYWVSEREVEARLADKGWERGWLMGWRDITNATNERTVIAAAFPRVGVGNKIPLILSKEVDERPGLAAAVLGCFSSLVLDYCARQKIGGTTLNFFIFQQIAMLSPNQLGPNASDVILPRVLELTYTAEDMRPFAEDLGYDGPPYPWDPERRAVLRAELDAYFAYLYGLTRRELQYILDPKAVMGADYPSETFRVLKDREIKEHGEYRTRRLVLEAWDRFAADGTFDPVRLREPQYIDRVADALADERRRREEIERDYHALIARADRAARPTLFVEGVTDVAILKAAWSVVFPDEPMPVEVLAAGGTKEMRSLSGKGKALREVLRDRLVLVLADNDAEGRDLTDDGHVRKGGVWRCLPNGIHWCLLKPTDAFAAAMKAHDIPAANWPFTVEAAFAPALRRQALAEGAYGFSDRPQAELLDNADVARRLWPTLHRLGPNDDAYFWLMAPHPEAKEAFAEWVTAPERLTEDNYAAFEEIVRGLRDLLARREGVGAAPPLRGAA